MELAGSNLTEDQLEDMLDKGEGAQLVGHVHIEGDADQLRQTINDIENRHEMFMSLEKSITELHDMFIDIATLIESQGEMVNRIGNYMIQCAQPIFPPWLYCSLQMLMLTVPWSTPPGLPMIPKRHWNTNPKPGERRSWWCYVWS